MIIHKFWIQSKRGGLIEWHREGWYLFGIIPLYIRDINTRERKHS